EWARGRIRRRKIKADPLAAMTLLALAAAVATHGEPGWSESIRVMYGISPGQLQTLGDVIEGEPRWRRRGVIVSAAPELTGRDLVALERVFHAVERAMSRANARQISAIARFSLQLRGPAVPPEGLTGEAEAGLRLLLKLARVDRRVLPLRDAPHKPLRLEVAGGRDAHLLERCWGEAVALGLLKARVRYAAKSQKKRLRRAQPERLPKGRDHECGVVDLSSYRACANCL